MPKILIVDDSPTETHKMEAILKKNNYGVCKAENGADGVELAKKEQPDLVLMDVVMPGLNGFQATRLLSRGKETSHIPVIIVTTKDQPTDKLWGKRQGAKGYIVKPVSEKTLVDVVEQVMGGAILI